MESLKVDDFRELKRKVMSYFYFAEASVIDRLFGCDIDMVQATT